jgi:hypothetical protein
MPLHPVVAGADYGDMSEERPTPEEPKKQPQGAALSPEELHVRQRELVRASLFARPETGKGAPTHRRWA